jgi:transcription elongation factor GreA
VRPSLHIDFSAGPQIHLRWSEHGVRVIATQERILLTQEGLTKVEAELALLDDSGRAEVAERIRVARESGDGAENCEFLDARRDLERLEARVAELRRMLGRSELIEEVSGRREVQPGTRVRLRCEGVIEQFQIVGSLEADPLHGRISNESPLGHILIGHHVGESVEWETPDGLRQGRLLAVS